MRDCAPAPRRPQAMVKAAAWQSVDNSVLNHWKNRPGAQCTVTLTRPQFSAALADHARVAEIPGQDRCGAFQELLAMFEPFDRWFNIVTRLGGVSIHPLRSRTSAANQYPPPHFRMRAGVLKFVLLISSSFATDILKPAPGAPPRRQRLGRRLSDDTESSLT